MYRTRTFIVLTRWFLIHPPSSLYHTCGVIQQKKTSFICTEQRLQQLDLVWDLIPMEQSSQIQWSMDRPKDVILMFYLCWRFGQLWNPVAGQIGGLDMARGPQVDDHSHIQCSHLRTWRSLSLQSLHRRLCFSYFSRHPFCLSLATWRLSRVLFWKTYCRSSLSKTIRAILKGL